MAKAQILPELDTEERQAIELTHSYTLESSLTIELTPEQTEFEEADSKGFDTILFSGGRGAGKSFSLCLKLLEYVSVPHTTVVLIRQNLTDLKKTTVPLLLYTQRQKDGTLRQPILHPNQILNYNRIEGKIELKNGSVIVLCGATDAEKLKSLACSCVCVEEASQIKEQTFYDITLLPRQWHPLGNNVYAATNPLRQSHYLYKYFNSNVATRKMVVVDSRSNKHLPVSYIKRLEALPPEERKRQLEGKWTNTDNAVFNYFSDKNVADVKELFNLEKMAEIVCGLDQGGGRKWAGMSVCGRSNDGKIYIFAEDCKRELTTQIALNSFEPYRRLSGSCLVYDKNNSYFIPSEFSNAGWKIIPSHNDLASSADLLNQLFYSGDLIIDSSCWRLIQQIEEQERDADTGKWIKTTATPTDILDAARYAVWHLSDLGKEAGRKNTPYWFF